MQSTGAIFVALLCTLSAFGQGRVNLNNTSGTLIRTNVYYTGDQGNIVGAGNYYFGLYVGTLGTPAGSMNLVALATNGSFAGRILNAGTLALPAPYDSGANYPLNFQVRGWSANLPFDNYEFALFIRDSTGIGLTGVSAIGTVTPTFGTASPAALFGTAAGQVGGFDLGAAPVPEPSTWALLILGAATLLWFRPRQSQRGKRN